MIVWIELIACAALIMIFGSASCVYGDRISKKTGIEASFIGVLFLAVATSLPEVITGLGTVIGVDKPNLGFADAIGSIIINFMIIGFIDYYQGRGRIFLHASRSHILTGTLTIMLLSILLLGMFLRSLNPGALQIFNIGLEMPVIFLIYLWGMRLIWHETNDVGRKPPADRNGLAGLWGKFSFSLGVIVLLGIWLVSIGNRLSEQTALSQTFIGSLFLGFTTSLPELFVAIAAIRIGSVDMAVGNILGSNFFDVCIIPMMAAFYRKGPLLAAVSKNNYFTITLAILLTAIAIAGLTYRSRDTRLKVGWDTGAIFVLGIAGFIVLYLLG